jgi:spore maturation protein SpmA
MLNYIWLGLIILGIITALTLDLEDFYSDEYANGRPINVVIDYQVSQKETDRAKEKVKVEVEPATYNAIYNDKIDTSFIFPANIALNTSKSVGSFYFTVDKGFPKIWQRMAAAGGEENDLTGKLELGEPLGDNKQKASFTFEEVSFLKLKEVTNAALNYAGIAVEIVIGLIGIMALWLGIMKIAEEAGIVEFIAKITRPVTRFLFPNVPQNHPAIGSIIMNISTTFLGLGNAATPFGIKAMEDLDKLNEKKGTATNAMIMLLVINTASFALMPTTAIALRASIGSSEPAIIIGTTMFGSLCATIVGITFVKVLQQFPIKLSGILSIISRNGKKIFYGSIIVLLLILFALFDSALGFSRIFDIINPDLLRNIIQVISVLAIPLIILSFVTLGVVRKVKIYEKFIEGAKEGFEIAVTIIPYLVAILVGIAIFRTGGAMEWLVTLLSPITNFIGMPAESLPMALMRPLSGSGSLGIMAEIMAVHGPDSFIGILVSTFFGSTETTFYVIAVYFGAINVKNTRYAVPAGLLSDIAGILAALFIVKLLFA